MSEKYLIVARPEQVPTYDPQALAAASQAKVIMCSHLYRELNAHNLQKRAEERGYNGAILVGHDLMAFIVQ